MLAPRVAKRALRRPRQVVCKELAVEIPHGQSVMVRVELGMGQDFTPEGVQVREQVATYPVHVDQAQHVRLLLHLARAV